jgi:hypothetical protein
VKFDFSGVPKRTRDREPAALLGKRIACARCDEEFDESELSTIPPDASPGQPRIYVCKNCK